jgi:hypothetical protein
VPSYLNTTNPDPVDIIVAADGDEIIVELDVQNNAEVRVGDQYTTTWEDGAITILRVTGFKSAQDYTNTIARRAGAMRDGVADVPKTLTARKAYQVKLATMRIEGEILPGGRRIVGASRVPDIMLPVERISDDILENFAVDTAGNLILGSLRSGSRTLGRVARLSQNYAGERMVILGMPGKGKSQMVRFLLSQAMGNSNPSQDDINQNNADQRAGSAEAEDETDEPF